jgi:hypothetical protein
MRDQEMLGLMEAYASVYTQSEDQEILSEDLQQNVGKALDAAAKNPVIKAIGKVIAPVGKGRKTPTKSSGDYRPVKEENDLFDYILEYLVAEGYTDTNESALKIMANMSEEWRESIVEEILDERNRGEQGMSDREVTRRRNLGGNVRSRVSASSLGDHGPQSAIQKFHKGKAKQRKEIHKSGRGTRGDTGESGGQSRYQANRDHSDGYPSITKRGDGPS